MRSSPRPRAITATSWPVRLPSTSSASSGWSPEFTIRCARTRLPRSACRPSARRSSAPLRSTKSSPASRPRRSRYRPPMYAIIAGGGKVGFFLARELIEQGHEVLIIEQIAERAEFIANELGNVVLRGNADEASTLAEAGAERADVVIAVTGDDEDNLVLLQVAKRRFGPQRTIARINDQRT